MQIIYEDSLSLPTALRSLVGVERYGDLVFRHQSMAQTVQALARSVGWPDPVRLLNMDDVRSLLDKLASPDAPETLLFWPSNCFPADPTEKLITFLRQADYSPSNIHIPYASSEPSKTGLLLLRLPLFMRALESYHEGQMRDFFARSGDEIVNARGKLRMLDISDQRTLQDVLSGQYDARHFNSVERQEYTVVKKSSDRQKLRSEFEFFGSVPPKFQMFLVQPFDFSDDGRTASYRMERVALPDMALQWVNGAFSEYEFAQFLKHFFYFLDVRPSRPCSTKEGFAQQEWLYVDKVLSRIEDLKRKPEYPRLAPLMQLAFGGIDALVSRYVALFDSIARRSASPSKLVIGHGDPCFSNILYSKTAQSLKLIDPRGVPTSGDPYTDPYYDVAKLSHSICGRYDFINHDKFSVAIDEKLTPRLSFETQSPDWAAALFKQFVTNAGLNFTLTRLYECSLFISMLPLHIDKPRKVLAFALNASQILHDLEKGKALP